MLELGQASEAMHRDLKDAIDAAGVDQVLACGPMMQLLLAELRPSQQGPWAPTSASLEPLLLETVKAGDAVMIKGSLGTRMALLVAAMQARFGPGRPGG
jgi:UDP-N-acetylmuramoyl-tripeptide--D-alanyl-D-alanine ligase